MCRLEHQTPGYTFLHDFALTPTHYVLVQNPVTLDPVPFMLGKISAASSVKWVDGKPAEVHMLRRPVVDAHVAGQQQQQQQITGHTSNSSIDIVSIAGSSIAAASTADCTSKGALGHDSTTGNGNGNGNGSGNGAVPAVAQHLISQVSPLPEQISVW